MLWIGLLAAMAVLAAACFWWDRRRTYVEEVVPFNCSAEQVDAARRLMEKERSTKGEMKPRSVTHSGVPLEPHQRAFPLPLSYAVDKA